jgi:hypothetical protein
VSTLSARSMTHVPAGSLRSSVGRSAPFHSMMVTTAVYLATQGEPREPRPNEPCARSRDHAQQKRLENPRANPHDLTLRSAIGNIDGHASLGERVE